MVTQTLIRCWRLKSLKVDGIATHSKMLETQISQVAQQQASTSVPIGAFPGQPEQNPRGHLNPITTLSEEQLVSLKGNEIQVEESFRKIIGEIKKDTPAPPEKETVEEEGKKATPIASSHSKFEFCLRKKPLKLRRNPIS